MTNDHPLMSEGFEFPRIDRWLRRVAVVCMVGVGVGLIGLGIALYAPRPQVGQDEVSVTQDSLGSR